MNQHVDKLMFPPKPIDIERPPFPSPCFSQRLNIQRMCTGLKSKLFINREYPIEFAILQSSVQIPISPCLSCKILFYMHRQRSEKSSLIQYYLFLSQSQNYVEAPNASPIERPTIQPTALLQSSESFRASIENIYFEVSTSSQNFLSPSSGGKCEYLLRKFDGIYLNSLCSKQYFMLLKMSSLGTTFPSIESQQFVDYSLEENQDENILPL